MIVTKNTVSNNLKTHNHEASYPISIIFVGSPEVKELPWPGYELIIIFQRTLLRGQQRHGFDEGALRKEYTQRK